MSDNNSARQNDIDVGAQGGHDDDLDESLVADRQPRAPSLMRLGRYRLVREIASGGMATVNLAVAEGLDKLVALKIIHPHLAQEDSFVRMFLDEARLASAISHRNVCNVFDFGETDGRYYIAMDYLAGQSLRDVLRKLRKADLQIEPRRLAVYVAYMVAEACEGLHAAHELHGSDGRPLNVVHRDVSPHNLFVTYDGNVSVVDFGIARASDRSQHTATGVLKGKFSYMAPEQMRQLEVDRRADVWALGVVLWEGLTLQRLFVRSSQADTVMSVMMDRVRAPSEVRPDIPAELDAITLRALSRSPAQRYPTAREMGRELMKFCRESHVMVSPIEIEQLMSRLFEKEIADSKQLMRRAKQSTPESGVWMEMTPSGFARVPGRSGTSPRSLAPSLTPPVDVFGEHSRSARMAPPAPSMTAPAAEALGTSHPDNTQTAPVRRQSGRLVGTALLAACAAVAGTWLVLRQPRVESLALSPQPTQAVGAIQPTSPAQASQPPSAAPTTGVAPTPTEAPAPAPAPVVEPVEPVSRTPATVGNESARRDARSRPRSWTNGGAQREAQGLPEAAMPRAAERVEEPARSAEVAEPAPAPEPRIEPPSPAPAPVAQVAEPLAQPAPQPVAPPPRAPTPPPAAPQKLDAQATIVDLDVEGALGSGVIARMLSRATPALKSCYGEAAKRAGRNDFGALQVSLVIDEKGAVRQLSVGKHGLGDLSGCATDVLKRMRSERVPDVGTEQVRFKVAFTP